METLSASQDDSSGANPSSVKSDESSPQHEGGRGSPPPKCCICLGTCRNKSFTDSCLHQFCFKCLLTWSRVKAECPLCKQNFKSIIHNVRSNHQYEEYMVEQRQTEETIERSDIDRLAAASRRFRYRTTLTLQRRETLAIQQLLLQYHPQVVDILPTPAPRLPVVRRRRSPASFRRTVYRHNLWARPLPDFTGRFRDCSPEFYRYNDSQMHRLVPWINRELHYLLNENVGHISYVMTKILELLPQYHLNSPEFREEMHRYFGEHTEHFLHELYCFASTPYDMTGYDRNVQYTTDSRISTIVNEVISSTDSEASVDSDIMMVSSSEPASEPPPGPSRVPPRVPPPVYPHIYIPPPTTDNVIPIETISQSDTDDDSSEVMVVGYVKPPHERTPEVVDLLGSDSDVIVQDTIEPEPATSAVDNYDNRPVPLVKLSLKRHKSNEEDSDTDEVYRPPTPRRRRRHRSSDTETTWEICRSTPSSTSWDSTPSVSSTTSVYTSSEVESTDDSYSSAETRTKVTKKKSKKKNKSKSMSKDRKKKKRSRSRKEKKTAQETQVDRDRSKRKSHSGKGVKSSKKSNEAPNTLKVEQTPATSEQAGPSGLCGENGNFSNSLRSRRSGRENRRLRSVVNVMYASRSEPSSSGHSNSPKVRLETEPVHTESRNRDVSVQVSQDDNDDASQSMYNSTDTEDYLPLNLTVQKPRTLDS